VWCGVVKCGVAWCGVVWCGVVWCGVVWCGVVWCGVVWCVIKRYMIDSVTLTFASSLVILKEATKSNCYIAQLVCTT